MTIEEVLSRLEPELRKKARTALDISPKLQPTSSIGLNEALNGGFGYGRISTLWGTKSAGKTALALQTVALAQEDNKICALMDVEGTYEDAWGRRLGVQSNDLIYFKYRAANKVTNTVCDLINAGVDLIVIDSISGIIPMAYLDKQHEYKGFEATGKIGAAAQDISKMLQSINYMNEDKECLILLIAQGRQQQVSSVHWGLRPTGGESLRYFSTQIVKLSSGDGKDNFIKGQDTINDRLIETDIGRKVNYIVQFNKLGPQNRGGTYDFYFAGDHVGVDSVGELVDRAVAQGIFKQAGSWISMEGGRKWQGRTNLVAAVREEPGLEKEIKEKLNG